MNLLTAIAMSLYQVASPSKGDRTPKPVKNCLECGKEHTHNNAWCSPQCCKLYRAKKKYQKRGENFSK